jgi:hypothetical protein
MPPAEYYSKTGRGYPDLAAVSNHYWVVNNKIPVPGKTDFINKLIKKIIHKEVVFAN